MAATLDSKSGGVIRAGSSPASSTLIYPATKEYSKRKMLFLIEVNANVGI